MLCKCSWKSGKEINVIKQIAVCDKCGKEMNPYTESNNITIKWDDKYFMHTTVIQLRDECYKEFMRIYLHENG